MSNEGLTSTVEPDEAIPSRPPAARSRLAPAALKLRKATPDDAAFVAWLTRATMEPYVRTTLRDEAAVERYFARNCALVDETKIIQVDGRDVGRLTVQIRPEDIFVDDLHVHPDFQRRGIGAAVLGIVARLAFSTWRSVRLQCLRTSPAIELFRRLGFLEERRDEQRCLLRLPPGVLVRR